MIAYNQNRRGNGGLADDPRAQLLANFFAQLQIPFAALNLRGEVIFSNDYFSRIDLKMMCRDGLARSVRKQPDEFVAATEACLNEDRGTLLSAKTTSENYILDLRPLHDLLPESPEHSIVTLIAYRLGSLRLASKDSLRHFYGMTARETEVTKLLVDGHSLEQIALHHDVSVGTVRGQLKSIFRKSGASRQAELVAKICY